MGVVAYKDKFYAGSVDEKVIVVSKAINTTLPANGSVSFQFQDVVPSGYYPISAVYDVGSGGSDAVHPSAVMVTGSVMFMRFNQLFDTASGSRAIKGTMVITCVKRPT